MRMRTKSLRLGTAILAIAVTQPLGAATDTKGVTINATVSAAASLTVSTGTLTFPNSNPETVPSIGPTEGVVSITAKARTSAGSPVTLTLNAAADLKSGSDTIAISNITWTASGAGFAPGTMAVLTEVTVASWTGSGNRSGSQTFAMANSWDYATGSYTTTATYTLTAP
jgi:hypothetical protein